MLAQPRLPVPRGPISEVLCTRLLREPGHIEGVDTNDDALIGDDIHLALHICFALHYDGFAGVDERWEWEPDLLRMCRGLEDRFLSALIAEASLEGSEPGLQLNVETALIRVRELLQVPRGPSLSQFMIDTGTFDNLREFVIHRSIYQRKEADPHTWAIPRLRGRAKSALVALQVDEYGRGRPQESHAELFEKTMVAFDLNPTPGAYIDQVPGATLATDNLVSLFGLQRRWRGALVGHLAAFEMTSVGPMARYAHAIRRLINNDRAAEFYDVHVIADAVHEQIATDELVTGLGESDPEALRDVPFGVAALVGVEARLTSLLLNSWITNRSSLLDTLVAA